MGKHFQKDLDEMSIVTIFDGVYLGGWLHEVSVDKDGNVEDSYSCNYLCKEGEHEVEK